MEYNRYSEDDSEVDNEDDESHPPTSFYINDNGAMQSDSEEDEEDEVLEIKSRRSRSSSSSSMTWSSSGGCAFWSATGGGFSGSCGLSLDDGGSRWRAARMTVRPID